MPILINISRVNMDIWYRDKQIAAEVDRKIDEEVKDDLE